MKDRGKWKGSDPQAHRHKFAVLSHSRVTTGTHSVLTVYFQKLEERILNIFAIKK